MTKRERVIAALNFCETDFVPYTVELTVPAWKNTAEYLGDENFMDSVGNHIIATVYGGATEEIKPGYFKDDFGIVWNRTGIDKDIGTIENIQIPEPEIGAYKFPQIPEERIRRDCERVLANKKDMFTVAELASSLFDRAWTLMGMENILAYMLIEPEFAHWFFDEITTYNLGVLKIYMEYDFDCVHFGDDWGQQSGMIMSPALWRKYIKPSLAEMYGLVKRHGKFVSQHSCGNIIEIFPDLIEIGLNMYQTFQPEIYDIKAVKESYGGKLTLWGGISTQRLLPFGTPERVVEVTKETISIMAKNGGYIAAPTHSITGDVPAENIAALINFLKNQE